MTEKQLEVEGFTITDRAFKTLINDSSQDTENKLNTNSPKYLATEANKILLENDLNDNVSQLREMLIKKFNDKKDECINEMKSLTECYSVNKLTSLNCKSKLEMFEKCKMNY